MAYLDKWHPHMNIICILPVFPLKDPSVSLHRSDVGIYKLFYKIYLNLLVINLIGIISTALCKTQ